MPSKIAQELASHFVNEVMEYDTPENMIGQIAGVIDKGIEARLEPVLKELEEAKLSALYSDYIGSLALDTLNRLNGHTTEYANDVKFAPLHARGKK